MCSRQCGQRRIAAILFLSLALARCTGREQPRPAREQPTAKPILSAVKALGKKAVEAPLLDPTRPGDRTRVILIGLDAATWVALRPLLFEGRLPHFAQLIQRGVAAHLATFLPTESPLIWTTIATGVSPARHGIQSFTRRVPGTDEQVPLRSD